MRKEGIILLEENQMHTGSSRIQTDDLDILYLSPMVIYSSTLFFREATFQHHILQKRLEAGHSQRKMDWMDPVGCNFCLFEKNVQI